MIKRVIFYLFLFAFLFALSAPSYGQTKEFLGAWLETPLKWTKVPAELQRKERYAQAAVLYFGSDHSFAMVYGTILKGSRWESLSRGDGQVVYLGKWNQEGATLHVEYRLVSRTVRKEGEMLPGPIQTEEAAIKNDALSFGKMRFHRDLRLDSDLQAVAQAGGRP